MKTLRLLMPQWQGGNNPPYHFGAKLLAWLAPSTKEDLQVEVPITLYDGTPLRKENGVMGQTVLLQQLKAAQDILQKHQPERVIVFGGDCLVSQAPFAYLNEKYNGKLGVLWLDAHPDVSTPEMFQHEHAMVLGNLLGEGDSAFASQVNVKLAPDKVIYGGLQKMQPEEQEKVNQLGLKSISAQELAQSSDSLYNWIKTQKIEHLAIHLDLDVLDPTQFRALLFSNPQQEITDASHGEMTLGCIARVIQDVAKQTNLVGLSIAEHLPWDALNLHNFLASLPIFE